jgi:hypothetical protein
MPPFRRRRDQNPPVRSSRLPGAGSISPEPEAAPTPAAPPPIPTSPPPQRPAGLPINPPAEEMPVPPPIPEPISEPLPVQVLGRFASAAGALAFAGQAMQAMQEDSAQCHRATDGSWWVAGTLPLSPAREMAGLGGGRLYVATEGGFIQDRGWGDEPAGGQAVSLPRRAPVSLLDLIRIAGLHPVPVLPLREACVLAPGYLVREVVERAQDLRLRTTYQLIQFHRLFSTDGAGTGPPWASYAIWLATQPNVGAARLEHPGKSGEPLPAALLAALADNPFVLVCRPVDRTLLITYGYASPLSDGMLARLVKATGDETWLLAPPPEGCGRITRTGPALDAGNLVNLGSAHRLLNTDAGPAYLESATTASAPVARPLSLVPTIAHAAQVDAVLLDDGDLECLPLLLAGDPLADSALLVRGAGRHLLTAPGGLLTEVAVGEPLTCIGPGGIYAPLGYRLEPPIGPSARAALFRPEKMIAQVMLRQARLGFDLKAAEPLWRLWAGPLPELNLQMPRWGLFEMDQAAAEVGDQSLAAKPDRSRSPWDDLIPRPEAGPELDPSSWRQQAYQAELNRNYVLAAHLYARNGEPLRAARMWERDAQEKY